jgi:5'-methylthioadenosine phosphorylase
MSQAHPDAPVRIAIVGGSGLYRMAGLDDLEEVAVETPFGPPSDAFLVGTLAGRRVAFLARHGRDHRLLPGEVNYRANIYALKTLGVERILSASAVGSMRESIHPRDVVIVDQFVDRTRGRVSTFFGDGLAAHVAFGDPVCPHLRERMVEAAAETAVSSHASGTYVCIEGPAFSTRAESRLYRSWGMDVIGMTNYQEARLAREAEICYATLALVTDYDCWHEEEEDVSVEAVLENLTANAASAAEILRRTVEALPEDRDGCPCVDALRFAMITRPESVPAATIDRLRPIVGRYFE